MSSSSRSEPKLKAWLLGILHLASLYHTNARPYDPLLNKIESRALSLMTALLFVGLFLFRVELELVQIIVTALMFTMLIAVVIAFCIPVIRSLR